MTDSSPRATGPAGGQFEAKVGAHYALALLANTEPFGLPGATIDRIEFQRAQQGHPLDDVIVWGLTQQGEQRCLEVQAKRSMSFTMKDTNFASVIAGIVKARKLDPYRRFAVAIERTTGAIDNGVQEVLELAQQTVDSASFLALLGTPGRSNKSMRQFFIAFKTLLEANGETENDAIYSVLRSFSVLTFDYARPNSIAEHLDRLRAQQMVSHESGANPYDNVFGLVLRADTIGGELTRKALIEKLDDLGVTVSSAPRLSVSRRTIEEISRHALEDIGLTVNGCRLLRSNRRRELEALLQAVEGQGGVVEISGPSGAGKSGLLRTVIDARGAMARVLVLAPDRTIAGGWPALRAELDIPVSADEFLNDLASDGGGVLCIDGLDRFRDSAQQKTVIDLLRAALNCTGVTVLFTAQPGWEEEGARWLGEDILSQISLRKCMSVEGLDDDEAEALAEAAPQLAHLLRSDHPAKLLARNPLKLRLLLSTRLKTSEAISEAALAKDWHLSGAQIGDRTRGEIHARKRVLNTVAQGLFGAAGPVDVSGQDAQAVAELIADNILIEIRSDRVRFKHDLFTDWSVAWAISEDDDILDKLALGAPPPFWMARGFDLACRMFAEKDDVKAWQEFVTRLEAEGVSTGWAGLALLAIIRSECAEVILENNEDFLLDDGGQRAAQLIRRVIASHTRTLGPLLKGVLPEGIAIPEGITIPTGPEWMRLILWSLQNFDRLGPIALSAVVELFQQWLNLAAFGEKEVTPILLERLADILVAETQERDRPWPQKGEPQPDVKYSVSRDALETARLYLSLFASISPNAAGRYLTAIKNSKRPEFELNQILEFPGQLPRAAPAAFALAFLGSIRDDDQNDSLYVSPPRRRTSAFSRIDGPFVLGKAGIGLFVDILEAEPAIGLSFIKALINLSVAMTQNEPSFSVYFLGKERTIYAPNSYGWSRGNAPTVMLFKALSALEHWAHCRIDSGEQLDGVITEIIDGETVSGAVWLVVVDLALTHSSLGGDSFLGLLSSPETLALDTGRAKIDIVNTLGGGLARSSRTVPKADEPFEAALAGRSSRSIALHDAISQLVFRSPEENASALHSNLKASVSRLGPWIHDHVDWASPEFMASYALRVASRENYECVTSTDTDGTQREAWAYKWPAGQKKWLDREWAEISSDQQTFSKSLAIRMAMDDETKEPKATVTDAENILNETVAAAQRDNADRHDPEDPWIARVAAAAFLSRFGSAEEVARRRSEIVSIFEQALLPRDMDHFHPRDDVMYDVQSLAIAGYLYFVAALGDTEIENQLYEIAAAFPANAAPAFRRHGKAASALDGRLLISLGRIALLACMIPRSPNFDENEAAHVSRQAELAARVSTQIRAERQWRKGGDEPKWPTPPSRRPKRPKRKLTIGENRAPKKSVPREPKWPDFYYDEKTGSVWLQILGRFAPNGASISEAVMRANRDWLIETNKSGNDEEDDRDLERVWTRGLMDYSAKFARYWSDDLRQELLLDMLGEFSDDGFIDAAAAFIVKSDLHFIEGSPDDRAYLLSVREAIWPRLKRTRHWRSHLWSSRDGMEIHLKELVSAFFMRLSYGFGHSTSYTEGLFNLELTPFLPLLSEIAEEASSCPTIAILYLSIVERLEPPTAERYLAPVAEGWAREAKVRFWNELGVGKRVLAIGKKVELLEGGSAWVLICEALMTAGVSIEKEFLERIGE
jgi:hypothetical protein